MVRWHDLVVIGKGAFTHVAVYQGRIAAANILGSEHAPADYRAVPVPDLRPRCRGRAPAALSPWGFRAPGLASGMVCAAAPATVGHTGVRWGRELEDAAL